MFFIIKNDSTIVVEAVVKNASEIPEVAEKVVTEIAENVTSGAPDGRPIVYR